MWLPQCQRDSPEVYEWMDWFETTTKPNKRESICIIFTKCCLCTQINDTVSILNLIQDHIKSLCCFLEKTAYLYTIWHGWWTWIGMVHGLVMILKVSHYLGQIGAEIPCIQCHQIHRANEIIYLYSYNHRYQFSTSYKGRHFLKFCLLYRPISCILTICCSFIIFGTYFTISQLFHWILSNHYVTFGIQEPPFSNIVYLRLGHR